MGQALTRGGEKEKHLEAAFGFELEQTPTSVPCLHPSVLLPGWGLTALGRWGMWPEGRRAWQVTVQGALAR